MFDVHGVDGPSCCSSFPAFRPGERLDGNWSRTGNRFGVDIAGLGSQGRSARAARAWRPMASVEPVKALDVTGEPVESTEGIVCASTGLRVAARARASRPYLISPSLRKAVP